MGVRECNRRDCDAIMVDRHSSEYGYICGDCFEEMCGLQSQKGFTIAAFMDSAKKSLITDSEINLNDVFESWR